MFIRIHTFTYSLQFILYFCYVCRKIRSLLETYLQTLTPDRKAKKQEKFSHQKWYRSPAEISQKHRRSIFRKAKIGNVPGVLIGRPTTRIFSVQISANLVNDNDTDRNNCKTERVR